MKKPKVIIVWKYIPQYRKEFSELLRLKLEQLGIELVVIYGQPNHTNASKNDRVDLAWGRVVHNTYFKIGKTEVCWQPILAYLQGSDLVIVEVASKLLVNYLIILQNWLGIINLAFWGHGINFQAKKEDYLNESVKRV